MSSTTAPNMRVMDPDGDVVCVLADHSHEARPKKQKLSGPDTTESPRRFRVSSKHLILASDYFKARLGPQWQEGKELAANGLAELQIDIPGCDAVCLEIIMNIIHHRGRQVPVQIDFDTLLSIALATDYLQCHEAVERYGYDWLHDLRPQMPTNFTSDTKNWMFIALVFRKNSVFQLCTELAQREGKGLFDSGSLPIPALVKGEIDRKRNEYLDKFFQLIDERMLQLLTPPDTCNYHCDAMHLGKLMKFVDQYRGGLRPHSGYSPASICADAETWSTGLFHTSGPPSSYSSNSITWQQCPLVNNLVGTSLQRHLDNMKYYLEGLTLAK